MNRNNSSRTPLTTCAYLPVTYLHMRPHETLVVQRVLEEAPFDRVGTTGQPPSLTRLGQPRLTWVCAWSQGCRHVVRNLELQRVHDPTREQAVKGDVRERGGVRVAPVVAAGRTVQGAGARPVLLDAS